VEIDGTPMLDGGIVDSIPVMRAMETGHPRNVVISTRNKGWRSTEKDIKIPHFLYKNYPRLRVALSRRVATYNEQLELLDKLEDSEQAFVIRPEKPLEVGRTTRDTAKLEALYEEGFTIGERFCKSQVSK
jgi:predicted patatin/cPLA2 family phospholipase